MITNSYGFLKSKYCMISNRRPEGSTNQGYPLAAKSIHPREVKKKLGGRRAWQPHDNATPTFRVPY